MYIVVYDTPAWDTPSEYDNAGDAITECVLYGGTLVYKCGKHWAYQIIPASTTQWVL